MTLPNFIIVGAAKAGTTSLYHYLSRHPQVFMSAEKEPHHFAPAKWCSHPVPSRREYERWFRDADGFRAVGEASTGYLYYPESPQMIHDAIPDCRIVVILRNPVDRAFSGYCSEVRHGIEKVSFEEALAEERRALRIVRGGEFGFNYIKKGFVAHLLRKYIELFGSERVHICFFDDLEARPRDLMRELFRFLGVDETFTGDWRYAFNPSGIPRIRWLHELLDGEGAWRRPFMAAARFLPASARQSMWHRLRDWNLDTAGIQFNPATRADLSRAYADEIAELESITGRDLSAWKEQ